LSDLIHNTSRLFDEIWSIENRFNYHLQNNILLINIHSPSYIWDELSMQNLSKHVPAKKGSIAGKNKPTNQLVSLIKVICFERKIEEVEMNFA
jgi:hypothetical protein